MSAPLPIVPFPGPATVAARVPGSKSLTNRALLLAALGSGPVKLENALFSDDTAIMAEALRTLGVPVSADAAAAEITIDGRGGRLPAAEAELFVGNAGTAARFLTALCAAAGRGRYRLDGVPQMRRRPIRGLVQALRTLGARIDCPGEEGCFPLEIHARGLRGGPVTLDARESSQMLSALLMVAPLADGPLEIHLAGEVRWPFVEMTLRQMAQFGQPAFPADRSAPLRPPVGIPYRRTAPYRIEPDATAASYFLALPLAVGGAIEVPGLPPPAESLQGDLAFAPVLREAGLEVEAGRGGLRSAAAGRPARPIDADFSGFSDTFLTLAALAPLLPGPTIISGIAHTRAQETDRVAGMARELRRLGQDVTEERDRLVIRPRQLRVGEAIETYEDHRFAMSFGILGCHDLRGDGSPWLAVRNPGCCAKTFPGFFTELERLRGEARRP